MKAPSHLSNIESSASASSTRRYTLKCHHRIGRRRVDRVIVRGWCWSEVKSLSERLQAKASSKPRWSSWSGRLYVPYLEK